VKSDLSFCGVKKLTESFFRRKWKKPQVCLFLWLGYFSIMVMSLVKEMF